MGSVFGASGKFFCPSGLEKQMNDRGGNDNGRRSLRGTLMSGFASQGGVP
jgi:hypothetical protein